MHRESEGWAYTWGQILFILGKMCIKIRAQIIFTIIFNYGPIP